MIDISSLNVPDEIRNSLNSLSNTIEINHHSSKGANGHLFFGRNTVMNRQVALKYYYWAGDSEFHVEPEALASVSSLNVIDVLHADIVGDEYALFVTPYCPAGDLDDLMETAPVSLHDAVDLSMAVLNGVSSLHSERLVHRDLKPANILLSDARVPLIGDFGSVKKLSSRDDAVPGSAHTILYRPPESFSGGAYAQTGDLYQCGLILYQLLGGRLPYDETAWLNKGQKSEYIQLTDQWERRKFVDQILSGHIQSGTLVKPVTMRPWVPKALASIVRKACHIDPGKRYGSASAMLSKLSELRPKLLEWSLKEGAHVLTDGARSFRVVPLGTSSAYRIEKRRTGPWQAVGSSPQGTLNAQVRHVESLVAG